MSVQSTGRFWHIPLFLAFSVFAIYVYTLCPSVAGGDSGELIIAGFTLGVPHPPGYPLFTLLAKLFTFIPLNNIAWRIHFVSALCDALAVFFLSLTVVRWTKNRWAGLVAGGLFAFAPSVWQSATVAEVFGLNNLCAALSMYLSLRFAESEEPKFLRALFFVIGLGLSNHHTFVFFALPVAVFIVWQWRRHIDLRTILFFVLGLTPYVYLPLAALRPTPAQWGDERSFQGFMAHLLRAEYGTFQLNRETYAETFSFPKQFGQYVIQTFLELSGIGLVLALFAQSFREKRWLFRVWLCGFVLYIVLFHGLASFPIEKPLFLEIERRFWQLPNLALCLFAGLGFAGLSRRWSPQIKVGLAIAIVLMQCTLHFRGNDRHKDWMIHEYGRSILQSTPPHTLVLIRGDLILNSTRYLQVAERMRPDVTLLSLDMLTRPWMKRIVQKLYPEVQLPGAFYHPRESGAFNLETLFQANNQRAIWFCGDLQPAEPFPESYERWPHSICDEIVPRSRYLSVDTWKMESERNLLSLSTQSLAHYSPGSWEYQALLDSWESRHRRGLKMLDWAMKHQDDARWLSQAAQIYEELLQSHPNPPSYYYKNLGLTYQRLKNSRAKVVWQKYLDVAPPEDKDIAAIRDAVDHLNR